MRSAAEIDAAKAVLTTTDLGAVVSEVRQFPPGYVTGGRLKLNTNLQIEVAPIAINIAGKDVRTAETVIIGNEHWIINGIETPRVPGSWYYLYLSTAGQFAVSPNEPTYNALYFAYYHPEISDLRAIGKFYYGSGSISFPATTWEGIFYVQTELENNIAEVWIGTSEITNKALDYICQQNGDVNVFLSVASIYLYSVFGGGIIHFTDGTFFFTEPTSDRQLFIWTTVSIEGSGNTIWDCPTEEVPPFYINFYEGSPGFFRNVTINRGLIVWYISGGIVENIRCRNYTQLTISANDCVITKNICASTWGTFTGPVLWIGGNRNIISDNIVKNCLQNTSGTLYAGLRVAGIANIVSNNQSYDNGNLIIWNRCESSSTSPVILGEAAPTASNCTWGFTATGPYEGMGCYRFTKTAAAGTIAYLHLVDNVGAADVHGLVPGTLYEWGGWMKVAASASCGYQGFRLYQATTGAGAASSVAWTTATTGWQEVWVTATVYAGATTAYIGLVASASLATMSFDVDNLRLFPPGTNNVHDQNYSDGGTDTYDGL